MTTYNNTIDNIINIGITNAHIINTITSMTMYNNNITNNIMNTTNNTTTNHTTDNNVTTHIINTS